MRPIHTPDVDFFVGVRDTAAAICEGRPHVSRDTAKRLAVAEACKKAGPLRINRREDLATLGITWLGVRSDWHEPDNQGLTARVEGGCFDNTGAWPASLCEGMNPTSVEMYVILSYRDEYDINATPVDIAVINLATLLGWASQPHEHERRLPGWPDPDARPRY